MARKKHWSNHSFKNLTVVAAFAVLGIFYYFVNKEANEFVSKIDGMLDTQKVAYLEKMPYFIWGREEVFRKVLRNQYKEQAKLRKISQSIAPTVPGFLGKPRDDILEWDEPLSDVIDNLEDDLGIEANVESGNLNLVGFQDDDELKLWNLIKNNVSFTKKDVGGDLYQFLEGYLCVLMDYEMENNHAKIIEISSDAIDLWSKFRPTPFFDKFNRYFILGCDLYSKRLSSLVETKQFGKAALDAEIVDNLECYPPFYLKAKLGKYYPTGFHYNAAISYAHTGGKKQAVAHKGQHDLVNYYSDSGGEKTKILENLISKME